MCRFCLELECRIHNDFCKYLPGCPEKNDSWEVLIMVPEHWFIFPFKYVQQTAGRGRHFLP